MASMLNFPADRRDINIPEAIGVKWHELGAQLLDDPDGTRVNNISHNHQRNCKEINIEIISLWLQGNEVKPVTWAKLVKVLDDIGKGQLAEKISETIHN